MAFHTQSWDTRFAAMGDEAEAVFEAVWPRGFARYGLDRPPIQMYRLSLMLRYTPDYITSAALIEVQGFGQDRLLKVKHEKLSALREWAEQHDVWFFLWDRVTSKWGVAELDGIAEVAAAMPVLHYPEGKSYAAIHVDDIPLREGWHEFDGVA